MRWKPAKGFLVDERNALVREIAVDPDCTVTFQEVAGAGAFLAMGSTFRVARYTVQTVRAGRLALVLIGAAPAEPDQIDFVRRILFDVQETLPVWVRDRLELARTEEARLEVERRALAAQGADVQRRARGVAGLQESTATAQVRTAADASALASRSASVVAGEASLAERAAAISRGEAELGDRVAAQEARVAAEKSEFEASTAQARADFDAEAGRERGELEALRATLEAEAAKARERGDALAALEASVQKREAKLETKDARLAAREADVEGRERESEVLFEELAAKVATTAKWERALAKKEEALAARERQLADGEDEPKGERRTKARH